MLPLEAHCLYEAVNYQLQQLWREELWQLVTRPPHCPFLKGDGTNKFDNRMPANPCPF